MVDEGGLQHLLQRSINVHYTSSGSDAFLGQGGGLRVEPNLECTRASASAQLRGGRKRALSLFKEICTSECFLNLNPFPDLHCHHPDAGHHHLSPGLLQYPSTCPPHLRPPSLTLYSQQSSHSVPFENLVRSCFSFFQDPPIAFHFFQSKS